MDAQMRAFTADLGEHEGFFGVFSRYEAKDAWPNGTRVRKVNGEDGDSHPDGTLGTVLGSLKCEGDAYNEVAAAKGVTHLYFVEFDASPGFAVGTISIKLEKADEA